MKRLVIVASFLFFAWTAAPAVRAQTVTDMNPGEITVTDPHGHASHATPVAKMNATTDKAWVIALMLGIAKQPDCCYAWDHKTAAQKVGHQHFHGELSKMAGKQVQTLTDPQSNQESEECKKMKESCMPRGDPRLKNPGTRECNINGDGIHCKRACGDSENSNCTSFCCKARCGCAHCE